MTMCSYIVEKAKLFGSAKGPNGWMRIDTANVYYDHPFHAPLDHALGIDFINAAEGAARRGGTERERASWFRRSRRPESGAEHGEATNHATAAGGG
jgi:hypothetical protein